LNGFHSCFDIIDVLFNNIVIDATTIDLEYNLELSKLVVKKQKYKLGRKFQDVQATQLPWA
jgi:fructose/tagatose bisphosphate aldolase